jgi:hypothetical protein
MPAHYPKRVSQYRKIMGVLGALHLGLAAWVAIWPGVLVRVINIVARVISDPIVAPNVWRMRADVIWPLVYPEVLEPETGLALYLPDHAMFIGMAAIYLLFIGLVGVLAAAAPEKATPYVPVAIAGKALVGLFGLAYYIWSAPYLANLLLPIIDLPLAILVLVFWLLAREDIATGGIKPAAPPTV